MNSSEQRKILKLARCCKGGTKIECICNEIDKHYKSNVFSKASLLERYYTLYNRKYHIYELLPQIHLGFALGLVSSVVLQKIKNPQVSGLFTGMIIAIGFVAVLIVITNFVFRTDKKLFEEYEMNKIQNILRDKN
jgi:hypothetical protein